MFNWDDWYLKTVAVHQGFKNFTVFFLYIVCGSISHQFVWNFSFLLEELLLKKSQVDLKGCLWGSFVSSFKFCPSPLFQQSDGVGGCSWLPDPGLGPAFLVDPSPCGSSSELPAWAVMPMASGTPPWQFLFMVAEGSFSSTIPVHTHGKSPAVPNRSPVHFTGLVSLMVPLT